jgi:hypothetical protein
MSDQPLRMTWAWVFTGLAALGLAAFFSLVVGLALKAAADVDLPEDEWGWAWIAVAWLGLLFSALFGTLAVATSRATGGGRPLVRGGLGLLAVVLIGLMVLFLVQGGALGWLLLVAVPPALYVLWRRAGRGEG